jgi:hypothetical protein
VQRTAESQVAGRVGASNTQTRRQSEHCISFHICLFGLLLRCCETTPSQAARVICAQLASMLDAARQPSSCCQHCKLCRPICCRCCRGVESLLILNLSVCEPARGLHCACPRRPLPASTGSNTTNHTKNAPEHSHTTNSVVVMDASRAATAQHMHNT